MNIAKVWALEADSPPKTERAAASSSMWRGAGSYCLANWIISLLAMRQGPAVLRVPTSPTSKYKLAIGLSLRERLDLTDKDASTDASRLSTRVPPRWKPHDRKKSRPRRSNTIGALGTLSALGTVLESRLGS